MPRVAVSALDHVSVYALLKRKNHLEVLVRDVIVYKLALTMTHKTGGRFGGGEPVLAVTIQTGWAGAVRCVHANGHLRDGIFVTVTAASLSRPCP
jgi:hypothetical protein